MANGNNTHRKKDSARLVWDTKPRRAPNPKDIEFQTAEVVIPNPKEAVQLPLSFGDGLPGDYSQESIENFKKQGRIYYTKNGKMQLIRYLDEVEGNAAAYFETLWRNSKRSKKRFRGKKRKR